MERIKLTGLVEVQDKYKQGHDADGQPYEVKCGYILTTVVKDEYGFKTFVYHRGFDQLDDAVSWANRIGDFGSINPAHWDCASSQGFIPDWATPEFAYRERNGLPL